MELQKDHLDPDKRIGARFGSVISKIGDINNDGYQGRISFIIFLMILLGGKTPIKTNLKKLVFLLQIVI